MARDRFVKPDVLVLAAGGVLGEAWMTGLLAGIEAAAGVDFRETEHVVGTSAGSIVAASLAAGRPPRRPRGQAAADAAATADGARGGLLGGLLRGTARVAWASTAPFAAPTLAIGAPAGAAARAQVLSRLPGGRFRLDQLREEVGRQGVRFDGRLRIVAVDRGTGRRVVFGAPGAPKASVADAVTASCSIPWVFAPVEIGGREYVDGGVWSITNLDAAPAAGRGTEVLCLSVAASLPLALTSPMSAVRAFSQITAAVETQRLRAKGARVRTIGPDADAVNAIGANLMDPAPRHRVLAAGFRQGRTLATP